jgi:hypothetical protein
VGISLSFGISTPAGCSYGIVTVPNSIGSLHRGDLLVSNGHSQRIRDRRQLADDR